MPLRVAIFPFLLEMSLKRAKIQGFDIVHYSSSSDCARARTRFKPTFNAIEPEHPCIRNISQRLWGVNRTGILQIRIGLR
jgi:hypothetical protein